MSDEVMHVNEMIDTINIWCVEMMFSYKIAMNVFDFSSNRRSQLMTLKQGMKWLDVSIF